MTRRFFLDRFFAKTLAASAWLSVLTLAGIFAMLLFNGLKMFETVAPGEFFSGAAWNPSAYARPTFGIGAMLWSSLMVTLGAMTIAVPLGIGTAAFLSEIAPPRLRNFLKPAVEMLAAVPSVVIGFLGIGIECSY
jgi:phosphate transport system permease protein